MSRNKTTGNLALTDYNDIFQSTLIPNNINTSEIVTEVSLTELYPPEFHPFNVNDDDSMIRLSENIKRNGVREPGLARPRVDGGYELLCGNRRKRACELAGIATMPVIIRNLDDNEAVITMVDSNLEQREKLLFSEKAWAYRVKLEALNHNGKKGDMLSVEVLVEQTGESKNQIFRLVRLTELIVTLLDRVDNKQLAFNPAVELSYLSQIEQTAVATAMDKYEIKPSLSQAVRLKKMKHSGNLTIEAIDTVLSECKDNKAATPDSTDKYKHFFPPDYSQKQIDTIIIKLLKEWSTKIVGKEVA